VEFESNIQGVVAAGDKPTDPAQTPRVERAASIRGIVLAGGPSCGECELAQIIPRPMLPVATRPLICHTLSWFGHDGVERATVCANGNTSLFSRHLRNGEGLKIAIDYTEDLMPRGPAGCVRDAAMAGGEEHFVVVEGGVIPHVDLTTLLREHHANAAPMTMVVRRNTATSDWPVDGDEPLGIYVFTRETLALVAETGFCDIKEGLIPELYKRGLRVLIHPVSSAAPPRISCPSSYLAANGWAVERLVRTKTTFADHNRRGDAWIHQSARVDDSVKLVGPVWIGPGTVVEEGAMIVGPSSIGAGCEVGAHAVVTRSTVWDRGTVGDGAIVDSTIVASGGYAVEGEIYRNTICKPVPKNRRGILGWFTRRSG